MQEKHQLLSRIYTISFYSQHIFDGFTEHVNHPDNNREMKKGNKVDYIDINSQVQDGP